MKNSFRAASLAILFILLIVAVLSIRPFGQPRETAMDDYFIARAQQETGSNNVVTSIVFDYRALDTLGETTVLFAAISGMFALFLGEKGGKNG
ncbi:MAG: hypothetical protein JW744_00975 [Candidatus Diapherotrites archaeon]|uniref:MrpA C-terminal/MbhE domain-containing protein n=1 Tax=Candidatus Iainarchaeum sp. TaxID=3101447 RepID=A0A938YWB5_9ARCH|nr:hypothetical protein [Candidatus Diapherotrites archaeon]